MRTISIALSGLILSVLINANMANAAPYIVTQSQSFTLNPSASIIYGSSTSNELYRVDSKDVTFSGTPGSILVAGGSATLTSVSFDLTSTLDYRFLVNCTDGPFSDCYTQGAYLVRHEWETSEGMFPTVELGDRVVHWAHTPSLQAHSSGEYTGTYDWQDEVVHAEPGQSFSLTASVDDLSFLDTDYFTVSVKRTLLLMMRDWDTNDEYNSVWFTNYFWIGNLTISYEYDYTPTPAPVPEPGVVLLVASGLIALRGLRRNARSK
jgi:hypothetical protein